MPIQFLTILVVEDHPDTLEVLGMFMELLGHRCTLAADAPAAIVQADNQPFDAIFTDVNLPGMEGWELLERLGSLGQLPRLVVSMSAGDNLLMAARSRAAGCHAHLIKPFRHSEIEAALNLHLPGPGTSAWQPALKSL